MNKVYFDRGFSSDLNPNPLDCMIRAGHSDAEILFAQIMESAFTNKYSDVHVEFFQDHDHSARVRVRIDGALHKFRSLEVKEATALVKLVKELASLSVNCSKPQNSKFLLANLKVHIRVATIPICNNLENLTLRILSDRKLESLPLERLLADSPASQMIEKLLLLPYGVIIFSGATGSGKTTTMMTFASALAKPETKLWDLSLENIGDGSVFYTPNSEASFLEVLNVVVNADPDVIIFPDLDLPAIYQKTIKTSLYGYLNLLPLFAEGTFDALDRLFDQPVQRRDVLAAVKAVVHQKLARRICPDCREEYLPEKSEYDCLAELYGRESFTKVVGWSYSEDLRFVRGKGCDNCFQTGYRGRTAIHEILLMTEKLKQTYGSGVNNHRELLAVTSLEGMKTIVQNGIEMVFNGTLSYHEFDRCLGRSSLGQIVY